MRKIIYTLIAILGFAKTYAQAPLGIPYQAAARKANGQALTNTAIKVRFSILDSVATGAVAFKETHTTTTNALGMFNLNVGMGTAITGTLAGVNWGNNSKFLQVGQQFLKSHWQRLLGRIHEHSKLLALLSSY